MKRMLLALSVPVVLAIAASTATAQNEIGLNASSNSMTFTYSGSTTNGGPDWTLNMNGLTGTASGTGALSMPVTAYVFTESAGASIAGTYEGGNVWDISQTGTLTLAIGSYLTGTLQLLNLGEIGHTAIFNYNLDANLAVTGGTLAGLFPSGGVLGITIDIANKGSLLNLSSSNQTMNAVMSGAELWQAPEPTSMALVGGGLLLLGGLVRRRRKA